MKLPAEMQRFVRNGANKEMFLQKCLLKVALKEEKKLEIVLYFQNANICLKITQYEAFIVIEKLRDHEGCSH